MALCLMESVNVFHGDGKNRKKPHIAVQATIQKAKTWTVKYKIVKETLFLGGGVYYPNRSYAIMMKKT